MRFAELTWTQVRDLDRERTVAILPTGATEAHGPHLPVNTDVIIAEAMAHSGAEKLAAAAWQGLILPPLSYTAASFAAGFPGTVSMTPATVAATIVEIGCGLARHGFGLMAIANAHLDPLHLGSIRAAIDTLDHAASTLRVVFPDLTRKPWALRLTDEFHSGACHAGQYETSIVMAVRADLVNESARRQLADNPASLSEAIRSGKTSFEAAGGENAYFGYPANASAREGHQTVDTLGEILCAAVLEAIASLPQPPQ